MSPEPVVALSVAVSLAAVEDFPLSEEALSLPLSEQALRARGRTAAAATARAVRRKRMFMEFS